MASGVDAPLSSCSNVLDRGAQAAACGNATLSQQDKNTRLSQRLPLAQAGAQTTACGKATLPKQEKGARQMSCDTFSFTKIVASLGRCPDGFLRRRDAAAAGEEHSAGEG